MALGTTLALVLLAGAPTQVAQQADASTVAPVDVAYEELADGKNIAAIERIEQNPDLERDDPARLINLGIAYARRGDDQTAREMFTAAARNQQRYRLETVQGDWMDSRDLARRALAMLDRGEFRTNGRVASR
ncbi:hypothetical protein [Allopontixanthobacter sp.]|uniref:hypothetical protein n=1 Tax=Allopontixanthobacter sp. TaxID=2906452 RepID=UPI002AB92560|nr:hypothetical protein [Allopontixanthobacter sp.]MDZ4307412.1 hypothetical protein [Allopontixanthobacter sp.]